MSFFGDFPDFLSYGNLHLEEHRVAGAGSQTPKPEPKA